MEAPRGSAARGDAAELARLRRLLGWTILATLALILIGGIVRISDSGLGCGPAGSGTEGWPLCDGGLLPGGTGESLIEFSHRVAAGVVAILIALCAWLSLRNLRAHRTLVRGSLAAVALVLVQAGLGGLTVERGLEDELVAAHLGLAMLLLGLLLLLRRGASPEQVPPPQGSARGLAALSALAATLVLATIVAGGYVAGTERHGTPDAPAGGQAHVACGTGFSSSTFPGCNGQFPGFGQSRLADIQLTHRALMYLASAAVLALVALAVRRRVEPRRFALVGGLLVAQVALGAVNVWAGKHAGLIVGHLMLGTLLWSGIVLAAASLLPASAASTTGPRRRESPEAAPA